MLLARLYQLQIVKHERYAEIKEDQSVRAETIESWRGRILDRSGEVLARDAEGISVWTGRSMIDSLEEFSDETEELLGTTAEELRELAADRHFVWVKRQLPRSAEEELEQLWGIEVERVAVREYPLRQLAAQVVGFTSLDHVGLEGLEYSFDSLLTGEDGKRRFLRGANSVVADSMASEILPARDGKEMILTLDHRLQAGVEEEIAFELADSGASKATVLISHSGTGEILALANYPTFDPNEITSYTQERLSSNFATREELRCGPMAELVDFALEIDRTGQLEAETVAHLRLVLRNPSRAGTPRDTDSSARWGRLGFGSKTGVEIPERSGGVVEAGGSIRYLCTPAQIARMLGVFANGGWLRPLSLVRSPGDLGRERPRHSHAIFSGVAEVVTEMLIEERQDGWLVPMLGDSRVGLLQWQSVSEESEGESWTVTAGFLDQGSAAEANLVVVVAVSPEAATEGTANTEAAKLSRRIWQRVTYQGLRYLEFTRVADPR